MSLCCAVSASGCHSVTPSHCRCVALPICCFLTVPLCASLRVAEALPHFLSVTVSLCVYLRLPATVSLSLSQCVIASPDEGSCQRRPAAREEEESREQTTAKAAEEWSDSDGWASLFHECQELPACPRQARETLPRVSTSSQYPKTATGQGRAPRRPKPQTLNPRRQSSQAWTSRMREGSSQRVCGHERTPSEADRARNGPKRAWSIPYSQLHVK